MRPGARRLDALDAELDERDAGGGCDPHGDRHARYERAVGAGHVDTRSVHAFHAHLYATPEGGHGFDHASSDEQLRQLGQDRNGCGHESHASPEFGRDKRQLVASELHFRRNLRKAAPNSQGRWVGWHPPRALPPGSAPEGT